MLRGRASHHIKVPDHCVSACDISLTETGKGSGPMHNPEIISAACHLYSRSILFSSFLQGPHLTITVVDVHPQQHLRLLITVPPTLQKHPLLYYHIFNACSTAFSHHLSECWCTKRYPGDAAVEETDGQPKYWIVCDIEATDTRRILFNFVHPVATVCTAKKDREKRCLNLHTLFLKKCICFDRLYILLCAIWVV